MKVPRPVRWLLVVLALAAGWSAGQLLDARTAARQAAPWTSATRPASATLPAAYPAAEVAR